MNIGLHHLAHRGVHRAMPCQWRLADNKSIANGSRFAMIPYDRTNQVFASTRAVVDARDQAGETVARRILFAIGPVLQRDAMAGAPTPATVKP